MNEEGRLPLSRRRMGAVEAVGDGVAQLHAFCNVGFVFGAGEALVVDTSNPAMGPRVAEALRETTSDRLAAIVLTHGHVDHVGGLAALLGLAEREGWPRPAVWGHEALNERIDRYERTWAWNDEVNRRQFRLPKGVPAFPRAFVRPDRTYRDTATWSLAGEPVELHHAKAETDDATWVWLPQRGVALVGDLSVQSLPNTGNPNKPQRYTLGWAEALEAIARKAPRFVVPGHGDPIRGDRCIEVLTETARALRFLHDAVVERLNAGRWPDEIVDEDLRLPPDLAAKPYLQPVYGCAQFVVRDVLRTYAGWWGGDPSGLIPATRREVALDLLAVAGRDGLMARARHLASEGAERRALHLAVVLLHADGSDREAQALVASLCEALASREPSFIVQSFYRSAAARARAAAGGA